MPSLSSECNRCKAEGRFSPFPLPRLWPLPSSAITWGWAEVGKCGTGCMFCFVCQLLAANLGRPCMRWVRPVTNPNSLSRTDIIFELCFFFSVHTANTAVNFKVQHLEIHIFMWYNAHIFKSGKLCHRPLPPCLLHSVVQMTEHS